MKQELSIAAILLAFGTFLCWPANTSSQSTSPTSRPSATASEQDPQTEEASARKSLEDNTQAWLDESAEAPELSDRTQSNATAGPLKDELQPAVPGKANQAVVFTKIDASQKPADYWHSVSDARSTRWLGEVARSTHQSKPLGAAIQLKANLFGELIRAQGKYFQAGEGRNQSRLELLFGDDENGPSIYHMCDGRFVYHLESLAGQPKFSFVDLSRIEKQNGNQQGVANPWMATGELSSFYQHILKGFNFGGPTVLKNGNVIIRGCWNRLALDQLLPQADTETDESIPSRIEWDQLPPQLPHGIELVFRPDKSTGYFPVQFTFVRFEDQTSGRLMATPILNISWSPPQAIASVNDRMFVIDSRNMESNDVTESYLARLREVDERYARQITDSATR